MNCCHYIIQVGLLFPLGHCFSVFKSHFKCSSWQLRLHYPIPGILFLYGCQSRGIVCVCFKVSSSQSDREMLFTSYLEVSCLHLRNLSNDLILLWWTGDLSREYSLPSASVSWTRATPAGQLQLLPRNYVWICLRATAFIDSECATLTLQLALLSW